MIRRLAILSILLANLTVGCDERVSQVAREAADRQAEQNLAMAELNRQVAGGTRSLVTADATARREIVSVHHDLQAERQQLDTGWEALEAERRQLAGQRRTESLFVPALESAGIVLAVGMLLAFLSRALTGLQTNESVDAELNELLVAQLLAEPLAEVAPARLSAATTVDRRLRSDEPADSHSRIQKVPG